MRSKLRHILHRLAHWLGVNHGDVVIACREGVYLTAFKCDGCGQLDEPRLLTYAEAMKMTRAYNERWGLGPAAEPVARQRPPAPHSR